MSASIPNINVGSQVRKRVPLDLSHDVSTTAHWGFVQPLMVKEMIPQSTMSVEVNQMVRLAPLPTPTMARASVITYHNFVRIGDLWEPFENFLSETPYFGTLAGISYIPTEVPYLFSDVIARLICTFGVVTVYSTETARGADFSEELSYVDEVTDQALRRRILDDSILHIADRRPRIAFQNDAEKVTLENADHIVEHYDGTTQKLYVLALRYTRAGRNLLQIFRGCGILPDLAAIQTKINMLKVFAYYRAYFDRFNPLRDMSWQSSIAWKLLHQSSDKNEPNLFILSPTNVVDFFKILAQSYYTGNPDYYSIQDTQLNRTFLSDQITGSLSNSGSQVVDTEFYDLDAQQPNNFNISSATDLNSVTLKLLQLVTKYNNRKTVFGGDVAAFLANEYGMSAEENAKSQRIGSSDIPVEIGDVIATTEMASTQGSTQQLGDYAGRGIAKGSASKLSFTAKDEKGFGYWVILTAVVPKSSYAQGMHPDAKHVERNQFYSSQYDALGWQISQVDEIMSQRDVYSQDNMLDGSVTFGFLPRYSDYKIQPQNILNGDFAKRSTRDSLLPYTLDRLFPDTYVKIEGQSVEGGYQRYQYVTMYHNDPANFVAGTPFRYVGRDRWNGNYDRIFYNSGNFGPGYDTSVSGSLDSIGIDDNFIIHNVLDITCVAPVVSMRNSYDTFTQGEDLRDVQHA